MRGRKHFYHYCQFRYSHLKLGHISTKFWPKNASIIKSFAEKVQYLYIFGKYMAVGTSMQKISSLALLVRLHLQNVELKMLISSKVLLKRYNIYIFLCWLCVSQLGMITWLSSVAWTTRMLKTEWLRLDSALSVVWATRRRFWPLLKSSAASLADLTSFSTTAWTYLLSKQFNQVQFDIQEIQVQVDTLHVVMGIFAENLGLQHFRSEWIDGRVIEKIKDRVVVHFGEGDEDRVGLIFINVSNACTICDSGAFVFLSTTPRSPVRNTTFSQC